MALENYVKFLRGTPSQYKNLAIKDKDTLYFISEKGSEYGELYLGTKLIAGAGQPETITFDSLKDITLSEGIVDRSLLVYDSKNEAWIDKPLDEVLEDIISEITPSVSAIQVFETLLNMGETHEEAIARVVGDKVLRTGDIAIVKELIVENKYYYTTYIYNDGWKIINEENLLLSDNKTVVVNNSTNTISLKDFGKRFYKYVLDENGKSSYQLVDVNEDNKWASGLEPRVVSENGELVLGWFEEDQTIKTSIKELQETTKVLLEEVGKPAAEEIEASGLYAELDKKANIKDVYTKEETIAEINSAIQNVNHLQRKIVASYSDIFIFIDENGAKEASKYIFMVPEADAAPEGNIYEEYLIIDGIPELIGKWTTDLSNYATLEDLSKKVDKKEGYRLISLEEIEKLNTIFEREDNDYIKSVSKDFFVDEDGTLSLNTDNNSLFAELNKELNAQKDSLNNLIKKVSENESLLQGLNNTVEEVVLKYSTIEEAIEVLNSTVAETKTAVEDNKTLINSLNESLKNYVTTQSYNEDISKIYEHLTWSSIED